MKVAITLRVMSLLGSHIANLIGGISATLRHRRVCEQSTSRCRATGGRCGLITAERDGYIGGTP